MDYGLEPAFATREVEVGNPGITCGAVLAAHLQVAMDKREKRS